jgi:microcompartment protein CcmL/EutN
MDKPATGLVQPAMKGGLGTVVITGALEDVEAAVAMGAEAASEACVVATEVLANPDAAVAQAAVSRRR